MFQHLSEPPIPWFLKLYSGIFPSSQQHAIVTPALKKPQLNPTVPNNYRPISDLSFVSKLLERVVAKQLTRTWSPTTYYQLISLPIAADI